MPASLSKKLGIKPGQRGLVINAPEGYLDTLGELPEGVVVAESADGKEAIEAPYDWVHLFCKSVAELGVMAPRAIGAVVHDGLLWISYPKRSSEVATDINRDVGWEVIAEAGFRPVRQVSVDAVWSALRFRPAERVGR